MYCTNCGNELNDKAVACPKCGCAVENNLSTEKDIKTDNAKGTSLAFSVFNYVSVSLICLAIMFFALSIIFAEILTLVEGTSTIYISSVFCLNDVSLIISFVLSLLSYVCGTVFFILGFGKRNKQKRILSDVLFIVNNCLLAIVLVSCYWFVF